MSFQNALHVLELILVGGIFAVTFWTVKWSKKQQALKNKKKDSPKNV
jgi:hypothetical protein